MNSLPERTFRVLVVDESPAVQRFVALAVGTGVVRVFGAADGHAALRFVEHARPDLVLCAAGMPGLVGGDLAERLSSRNLRVVLMAGSLDRTRTAAGAAVSGVIAKPLEVPQLRDLVSRMVAGWPDLHDEPEAVEEPPEPDAIETWLCEVDAALGFMTKRSRRRSAELGLHTFAHNVAAFRARPVA